MPAGNGDGVAYRIPDATERDGLLSIRVNLLCVLYLVLFTRLEQHIDSLLLSFISVQKANNRRSVSRVLLRLL